MKKLCFFLGLFFIVAPLYAWGIDGIQPTQMTHFIHTHNPLVYLSLFFGLGVFLAFTPCVLPMVPILSGIITGQNNQQRAFSLSLAYVIGMALTYAVTGMLAAYFGSTVQTLMQQPVILTLFSILFIGLAGWLWGLFNIKWPVSSNMRTITQHQNIASAALMGILSTLVVSPCVTAPLIGILTYIAQSGQMFEGGLMLFVLALGMGLPLLVVGAGYGKLLPHSGAWMIRMKQVSAWGMVAMAIMLLGRMLPPLWTSVLWALLCLMMGLVWLLDKKASSLLRIVALGFVILSGGLIFKTIESTSPIKTPIFAAHQEIHTLHALKKQLALASDHHQPVVLEFFATWCSDCQSMDKKVFNQPAVIQAMQNKRFLRVNLSDPTEVTEQFKQAYGIYGIPTILFYDANGKQQTDITSIGAIDQQQMLRLLNK